MAVTVPITERSHSEQDILIRQINLRKARMSTAAKLSELFAMFSLLGSIDININEGDASPELIIAFVVNTSLLVTNTILIKLATLWMSPRLNTALLLSTMDLNELDQVPYESLMICWDVVWVMASTGGFLLFGVEFILISWIKFQHYSKNIAITATAIMGPVVFCMLIRAIYSLFTLISAKRKIKHRTKIIQCHI